MSLSEAFQTVTAVTLFWSKYAEALQATAEGEFSNYIINTHIQSFSHVFQLNWILLT